jgi:23S rRNA pseudouridine1911/1915/1917 synthase
VNIIEIDFPEDSASERLDQFIANSIAELSRASVHRLIAAGEITVNGLEAKPSLKLKGGEHISVNLPPPESCEADPEDIPLDILYEDSDVIVVNKPAGMVVHPGAGNSHGTLVNALLGHCTDLSGIGGAIRPGIVHRIDKDTSGVIIAAKNDHAHQSLALQFKEHTIKRVYFALVFGSPKTDTGHISSAIGRHPVDRKKMSSKSKYGKEAVTHWKVLARYEGVTLMRLRLETGRTHQIRVHMSEAGHPLVGDQLYGTESRLTAIRDTRIRALLKSLSRQALHAKTLGFIHPSSGQYLEFDTDLPEDMQRVLQQMEVQPQNSEGACS